MTRSKPLTAFLLTAAAMLALSGCHTTHRRHLRTTVATTRRTTVATTRRTTTSIPGFNSARGYGHLLGIMSRCPARTHPRLRLSATSSG
jgi:hypothetical protein